MLVDWVCGLFTNCFIYTYYLFPWLFSLHCLIITCRYTVVVIQTIAKFIYKRI
jgi:hypothetical protein